MKTRKIIFVSLLISLFFFSFTAADVLKKPFSLSILYKNSDLIVIGTAKDVDIGKENHKAIFEVEEWIKGESKEEIEIITPLYRGMFKEHEVYIGEDSKLLLFLSKNNNSYGIVKSEQSIFSPKQKEDIGFLLERYNANSSVFTPENKEELKSIYHSLKFKSLKKLLLFDLENILDVNDSPFISSLLDESDVRINISGIMLAGRLKIESLYSRVTGKLNSSNNSRIIHHCIVSIGDYGKEESADIIIPYFKHERQEIVRAAIDAAGQLKNEKFIKHLKDVYNQEMDFIGRIAVVESLCRMKNRVKAKEALDGLLVNETMPLVKNFIVKNKNKLE